MAQGRTVEDAEFPFQFREGLIWLQARTDDSRDPLEFILDSGAEVSVLNLRAVRRLHLGEGSLVGVRGVRSITTGYWPERLKAHLGEVRLPSEYLALNLDDFSKACDGAVDGLLGADFFRRHVVEIDFVKHRIHISHSLRAPEGAEILRLKAGNGSLRVAARIGGQPEKWLRLDTGCASAIQWVNAGALPSSAARQVAVGLSEITMPVIQTNVRLGGITLSNILAGVQPRELFPGEAGLLGAGALSRFSKVTIDAKGGRLRLETNSASH